MKRPLLAGLLFLVLGILAGQYITAPFGVVLFFLLACFATTALYFIYKQSTLFVLVLFYLAGFFSIHSAQTIKNDLAEKAAIARETAYVSGIAEDIDYTSFGSLKVIISADKISMDSETEERTINIIAYINTDEEIKIGQRITVVGILTKPDKQRNDGGFDEFRYLSARNIRYKMNAELISKGKIAVTIKGITNGFKDKLVSIYDASLPPAESSIIKAMLLGDKVSLDVRVKELYKAGGIYHILAISGLHITVLAFLLDFLFKKWLGPIYSGVATLFILCFYATFTGLAVSTIRAVIMFGVYVLGRLLWRKSDLLSSSALAACIILLVSPYYLWDGGFLLSFSSVFGIGFGSDIIKRFMLSFPDGSAFAKAINSTKFFSDGIPASVSATIFNTPVAASIFYQVPAYGILANLIIVPTVVFVVIVGIIIGTVGFFSLPLASFISGSLFYILKFYELICIFVEKLPASMIITGQKPFYCVLLWYATAFSVLALLKVEPQRRKFYIRSFFAAALTLVLCFGIDSIRSKSYNYVSMLDVGQGDCIVIRNSGKTFLIDGGESWNSSEILSYLHSKGIGKIDGVFVTHTDSDHVGGIIPLVGKIDVSKIYLPPNAGELSGGEEALQNRAKEFNVEVLSIKAGDMLSFSNSTISCIYPYETDSFTGTNATSLVLMYETLGVKFLLTGDIGIEEESRILKNSDNISCYVLKLAHHGSAYSNSEQFLAASSPKVAIVGTGKRNLYGHPSEKIVQSLTERGIPLYNTADCGQITASISKDGNASIRVKRVAKAE